jgi:hypothetical protein
MVVTAGGRKTVLEIAGDDANLLTLLGPKSYGPLRCTRTQVTADQIF